MNKTLFDAALAERGLSQTKLAQHLDINPVTIHRAYRGDFEPRLEVARNIARYLGLTVDALFPGEGEPTPTGTDSPRKTGILRSVPRGDAVKSAAQLLGARGGRRRGATMTAEQRSAAASRAALARRRGTEITAAGSGGGNPHTPTLRLIDCVALRRVRSGSQRKAA